MSYADVLRRNIQQAFQHRDRRAAEELLDRLREEEPFAEGTRALAQDQRTRLKAAAMGPEALGDEVETRVELGEGIPDTLFANYAVALLRAGARHAGPSRATGLGGERGSARLGRWAPCPCRAGSARSA